MSVFELVHTYEEVYWSLGMFPSMGAAILAIDKHFEEHGIPPHEDRNEIGFSITLEIREWQMGLSESKSVWESTWREEFDDATDESKWVEQ